jgi:hypothetical protein
MSFYESSAVTADFLPPGLDYEQLSTTRPAAKMPPKLEVVKTSSTDRPCLDAALEYAAMGFSVIPVRKNKRPYVVWQKYQSERATEEQIRKWWKQWPGAGVAIVTGAISGIVAVDCDTEAGRLHVESLIPDSCETPIAQTQSGGWHYYFKHRGGTVSNSAGVIPGVDVRGDGGYIVAPPTRGEKGDYSWLPGLSLGEVEVAPLPAPLARALNINSYIRTYVGESRLNDISCKQGGQVISPYNCDENGNEDKRGLLGTNEDKLGTNEDRLFTKGRRDNDLFRTANYLIRGGAAQGEALKIVQLLAKQCSPPFPESEARVKVQSALDRANQAEKNLTKEIREWCLSSSGDFLSSFVLKELGLSSRVLMKQAYNVLARLCDEGLIEKASGKRGHYRTVNKDLDGIDWLNASDACLEISWPFAIESLVQTNEGNIIVVAGAPNSGKTAFAINTVSLNQHRHDVHYFSSEMGASELRKRLLLFDDVPIDGWRFHPWERSSDFPDVIRPDGLNIIDYLEIHDNFYLVGQMIKHIHDKLKRGVAVVCLQKNPGQDAGLGGQRSLEKARLAIALDNGQCRIIKAKNWATQENPNGLIQDFKLVDGCKFIPTGQWYRKS